jgi:hypothetical protein
MLLITATFVSVGIASPPTIKQSYDSQIGVREATGNNDGKAVKMYLATVNLPEGYFWCAAFVKWNLLNAGITSAKTINGMALSCESKHIIYKKQKLFEPLRPGDVATLYYANLKRIGHTYFYDKPINKILYQSVEGNTSSGGSRNGDGVYRRYRSYRTTWSITRW